MSTLAEPLELAYSSFAPDAAEYPSSKLNPNPDDREEYALWGERRSTALKYYIVIVQLRDEQLVFAFNEQFANVSFQQLERDERARARSRQAIDLSQQLVVGQAVAGDFRQLQLFMTEPMGSLKQLVVELASAQAEEAAELLLLSAREHNQGQRFAINEDGETFCFLLVRHGGLQTPIRIQLEQLPKQEKPVIRSEMENRFLAVVDQDRAVKFFERPVREVVVEVSLVNILEQKILQTELKVTGASGPEAVCYRFFRDGELVKEGSERFYELGSDEVGMFTVEAEAFGKKARSAEVQIGEPLNSPKYLSKLSKSLTKTMAAAIKDRLQVIANPLLNLKGMTSPLLSSRLSSKLESKADAPQVVIERPQAVSFNIPEPHSELGKPLIILLNSEYSSAQPEITAFCRCKSSGMGILPSNATITVSKIGEGAEQAFQAQVDFAPSDVGKQLLLHVFFEEGVQQLVPITSQPVTGPAAASDCFWARLLDTGRDIQVLLNEQYLKLGEAILDPKSCKVIDFEQVAALPELQRRLHKDVSPELLELLAQRTVLELNFPQLISQDGKLEFGVDAQCLAFASVSGYCYQLLLQSRDEKLRFVQALQRCSGVLESDVDWDALQEIERSQLMFRKLGKQQLIEFTESLKPQISGQMQAGQQLQLELNGACAICFANQHGQVLIAQKLQPMQRLFQLERKHAGLFAWLISPTTVTKAAEYVKLEKNEEEAAFNVSKILKSCDLKNGKLKISRGALEVSKIKFGLLTELQAFPLGAGVFISGNGNRTILEFESEELQWKAAFWLAWQGLVIAYE